MPLHDAFIRFRESIDAKQRKREALMQFSRKITQLSKKAIVDLHLQSSKLSSESTAGCSSGRAILVPQPLTEAREELRKMYKELVRISSEEGSIDSGGSGSVAVELDVVSVEQCYHMWGRTVSAGLQEFIEACALLQYLQDSTLVSIEQIYSDIAGEDESCPPVYVSPEDFLLGILDLSGELMRLCVNASARGDWGVALSACDFLKSFEEGVALLPDRTPEAKELPSKKKVLLASVKKCEKIIFDFSIRAAEFPEMDAKQLAALVVRSTQSQSADNAAEGRMEREQA